MNQEYFTVQELAKYSRIGQKKLYDAVRSRELRHVSIGKKAIISKRDFETWFESKTKEPVPEPTLKRQTKRKSVFSLD